MSGYASWIQRCFKVFQRRSVPLRSRTKVHKIDLSILSKDNEGQPFSLILCNNTFDSFVHTLWDKSRHVVCADGASHRLFDLYGKESNAFPDYICGDLDSSDPSVLRHYRDKGTKIVRIHDQNHHDLEKSIAAIHAVYSGKSVEEELRNIDEMSFLDQDLVIYPVFGGRIDQEMAIYNMAFKHASHFRSILLTDSRNFAVVIPSGVSEITIDPSWQGPNCGIIPIGEPCKNVSTKGLKYDMFNEHTRFGGVISSSNSFIGSSVRVDCTSPLLLVLEISNSNHS